MNRALRQQFADLVRRRMAQRDISASALARATSMGPTGISHMLSSDRLLMPTSPLIIWRICQVLGIANEHAWALAITGRFPTPIERIDTAIAISELMRWADGGRIGVKPHERRLVNHCYRCGHEWQQRRAGCRSPQCPACNSILWDRVDPTKDAMAVCVHPDPYFLDRVKEPKRINRRIGGV